MGERLTQGDVEKIKQEIEYRTLVVRKEAIGAVQEARAQGDLSENFEYYAAKKDKNKNESRIRYLERMLKNATIISDDSAEGVVGLNKQIEVYLEDEDVTETFKLVTSVRCDSISGKISIESPMGKAINGHRVGDRVFVRINDRIGYYVVIRSITDGDDSDDTIRPY
ncbi:MAG: GreA/GreB family elongation factor [Lachnospiraceae bacterium]|nr:GreA/GreB family elongation factor [Lachnospiraceae bacterium]